MPPVKDTRRVWAGPEVDGITYSLLCRFLSCRERFRLLVMEGIKPADTFNHHLEYGNLWHTCEEAHAAGVPSVRWETALHEYAHALCQKYPTQQEQVEHWYQICKLQFPLYIEYWNTHKNMTTQRPLAQEQVFSVPYTLPSGRVVRLRGKWDSLSIVGTGRNAGIYLQENKTKGEINEGQLLRQLSSGFDLQTMLYMTALEKWQDIVQDNYKARIAGVCYNVVRRPLSGGKGTILRHKPTKGNSHGESKEAYYKRVAQYIKDEPEDYFMRWNITIAAHDIVKFRRECLEPILEQLWDWWDHVTWACDPFNSDTGLHFRFPYGVYNPLVEGYPSDLDNYIDTGSMAGLEKVTNLFPELT